MSMAMQRVVQCADVLVHIFEQMSPSIWNDGDTEDDFDSREERALERKSLASAARVSHAFSESALDVLWSVLDHIDDLLLVLPVTVVPGATEHDSDKTVRMTHDCRKMVTDCIQVLVQDITPEQWLRFRAYAKRVRALEGAYQARSVDPSVWLLLEHRCEGTPLLPNLRRVQLNIRLSLPGEAFYFLTASVTDLQMNIESADFNATPTPDVAGVLYRLILVKLPHLRTLKVTGGLNELRPHYLEPITTLQSLHRLDMLDSGAMFDHAMLESVSSIASLRILWMDISYGSASGPFQGSLKGAFCDLITLHVRGSARDLDRFFSSADLGKLSTLHMNFTDPSGVPEICHAIHRASSALSKALEHCQLELTADFDPHPLGLREIVAPLLTLRDVLSFHVISHGYIPHVSDEDILTAAAAWPNLKHLGVWKERSPPTVLENPSVASLVELARLCPNLSSLMLRFLDVTAIPDKHTLAAAGHNAMQYLDIHYLVGAPTTADLFDLAIVIDLLFPNLVPLESGAHRANFFGKAASLPEDGQPDPWQVTHMMLSVIQLRRRHVAGPSGESEGEAGSDSP